MRSATGPIPLGGAKTRALLAALLLERNRPVDPERLALALWGEDAAHGSGGALRVQISRLRALLGDTGVLVATAVGYELRVASGAVAARGWFWSRARPDAIRDAPELARLLPELGPAPVDSGRHRFFEAVTDAIGDHALFVLDDLHWADAPTLTLLRFVLRRASCTFTLVATSRDAGDAGGDATQAAHEPKTVPYGVRLIDSASWTSRTVDQDAQDVSAQRHERLQVFGRCRF